MKEKIWRMAAILLCIAQLAACAIGAKHESADLYDLGPLAVARAANLPALPPISIASIEAPAWLDSTRFYYRLNYANQQQPHPYAQARWTMPPAQLLQQRLKGRIAQAGGVALSSSDAAFNVPTLRIDADDFTQSFETAQHSSAQISLRASLFQGRQLLAQRSFRHQAPASTPDAAGGAHALAAASDDAIIELMQWLATLPLK